MARRLLFCGLNVLLSKNPHLQLLCGVVLAALVVAVQFASRPFINLSLDLLVSRSVDYDDEHIGDCQCTGMHDRSLHLVLYLVRYVL